MLTSRYVVAYDGDVAHSGAVTHIVLPSWNVDKWDAATRAIVEANPGTSGSLNIYNSGAKLVSAEWVKACAATKRRLAEDDFPPAS